MITIHHPLEAGDRDAMVAMRQAAASAKGQLGPDARVPFDEMIERTHAADGVTYAAAEVGGVPGWWCQPNNAVENAAILYLHGGAYVVGSARAYRHLVGQIAVRAKAAAFVAEYRLAPEHPFPGAVEDARAAYNGLTEQGFTSLALAGDSAGGGLTLVILSLAVAEAQNGRGLRPKGAAVMSPWTDLALDGTSLETHAAADPALTREALASAVRSYLGPHDARDPLASPLYGDLAGLPPVRLHVGEDEILLDDSRRYAERFAAEEENSQLHVWEGMTHVFPASLGMLAAADAALGDIGTFLRERLNSEVERSL